MGAGQVEVEKGLELPLFPDAQVCRHFFAYDEDFPRRPVRKATGNPGLDDEGRRRPVNLSHERPGGCHTPDSRDQGGNAVASVARLAGLPGLAQSAGLTNTFQQTIDSRLNFKWRSGDEKDMHGANIGIIDIPALCITFAKIFIDSIMVYLTRLEHFNAAHKLYNPAWSKDKNEAVFGKCANENWHGHNYELYVTIKGDPDPETGFLFDVKKLSSIIKDHVTEKLDHKNLNIEVDFLQGKMCSTENLAIGIWQQLQEHLPEDVHLHCVKLYETPRIYVEYFG
jgi:6-pyruvoyltetrahydropterin/6-carboxytetrahydropterin synthase